MLLLSRESELKMSAELVPDSTTKNKDNSFALKEKFTENHQINLVVEDTYKQQAIFVLQSLSRVFSMTENSLIDSLIVLKLVLVSADKLLWEQMNIALPERQVNAKVFYLLSEKEDNIHFYCFY